MARKVPDWVGKTDDSPVPDGVWKRVLRAHNWTCKECGRDYRLVKKFHCDHRIALINWNGPEEHGNRESNLQPLCEACHGYKTAVDVREKAETNRKVEMRPGYAKYRSGKVKYNWKRRRYELLE